MGLRDLAATKGIRIGALCQPFGDDLLPQAHEMVTREYNSGTLGLARDETLPASRRADWNANTYVKRWLRTLEQSGAEIFYHRLFPGPDWIQQLSGSALRSEVQFRLDSLAEHLEQHPRIRRVLMFNEEAYARGPGFRSGVFDKIGEDGEGLVWTYQEAKQRLPSHVKIGYSDFSFEWWAAGWSRSKWSTISSLVQRASDAGAMDFLMAQGHITGETIDRIEQLETSEIVDWLAERRVEYIIGEHDVFTDSYEVCRRNTRAYLAQCLNAGVRNFFTWELANETSWVRSYVNIADAKPCLFELVGNPRQFRKTPAYDGAASVLRSFQGRPGRETDPVSTPDSPKPDGLDRLGEVRE